MSAIAEIIPYVLRYPACVFWLTCIVIPTAVISSTILYIVGDHETLFPSICSLLSDKETKGVFKIGLSFGIVTILLVHKSCHTFYQKLKRMNKNNVKVSEMMKIFVMVLDVSMIITDLSLVGLFFISFDQHQILHIFITILFYVSSLVFHFAIDEISANLKKSIPVSNSFNIIILVLSIMSGVLFTFSKVHTKFYTFAAAFELVSFIVIFFKYIFVAMIVLGAAFLPKRIFEVDAPEPSLNDEFNP